MPLPDTVDAIQPRLMREEVYVVLKRWIVEGTLRPGEKVRDVELADRLGLSRMPVREALNRLADEGFVETSANRWTRVTTLDPDTARRIYPLIWSLEPLALTLAGPNLEPADIDEMVAHNERLRHALEAGWAVEASLADSAFHQVYVNATRNPELVRILAGLKAKLRRIEVAYFGGNIIATRSVQEHERLVEDLRRGEIERASRSVRQNWQRSFERILRRQEGGLLSSSDQS
jgi:DNA-binding GntR family transcriptional regulator